jgi:hypothetical protein
MGYSRLQNRFKPCKTQQQNNKTQQIFFFHSFGFLVWRKTSLLFPDPPNNINHRIGLQILDDEISADSKAHIVLR